MKSSVTWAPKCLFAAWVLGWVTSIYLPSFTIALLALSPLASADNILAATFAVADEVSPAAKLAFAVVFGSALLAIRLARADRRWLADAAIGVISIMLVVAFLPENWSRGFGVGLAGNRFDLLPTMIYLVGGFLSGVVFWLVEARCVSRSRKPADR